MGDRNQKIMSIVTSLELSFVFPLFLVASITFLLHFFLWPKPTNPSNSTSPPLPPSPPRPLPLLGHFHLLKKPLHRALARLSQLHGPVLLLRFGSRRVLLVSSLSAALQCFTANDLVFASRPLLAPGRILGYDNLEMGFAPYGPHWRNLRRLAAVDLLSTQSLGALSGVRSDGVLALARDLAEVAAGGGFVKVEMRPRLFGLIINILIRMVVGASRRSLPDAGTDLREMVEETFAIIGETNVGDHVPLLRWVGWLGVERRMWSLRRRRDAFLQVLIDERRRELAEGVEGETADGRRSMLDVMLSLQDKDPGYYTDDIVKSMILSILSAGSDTTATTIEWAMSLLLNNPGALLAAKAEISKVVPPGEMVRENHLQQLPYIQAIISETLRLYPVAPLLVPHQSREDCIVDGYRIPCGVMLMVNVWAIHRDGGVWAEAGKFKPERFLCNDDGTGTTRVLPFGLGRRSCPGEGLAMRMVGLTLATLVQCFEWDRVGGEEVDMREGDGLTMPRYVALEAMCKLRDDMVSLLLP